MNNSKPIDFAVMTEISQQIDEKKAFIEEDSSGSKQPFLAYVLQDHFSWECGIGILLVFLISCLDFSGSQRTLELLNNQRNTALKSEDGGHPQDQLLQEFRMQLKRVFNQEIDTHLEGVLSGNHREEVQIYECYSFDPNERYHEFGSGHSAFTYETTYKNVFVKYVSRVDLDRYELNRQIVDWARKVIQPEDIVVYNQPEKGNVLNIVMLAILTRRGKLILLNEVKKNNIVQSLEANNISASSIAFFRNQSQVAYSQANVIIGLNTPTLAALMKDKLPNKRKLLLYFQNEEQVHFHAATYLLKKIEKDAPRSCKPILQTNYSHLQAKKSVNYTGYYELFEQLTDKLYLMAIGHQFTDEEIFFLEEITSNSQVEVRLIRPENLRYLIRPEHPLPSAYQFLSEWDKNNYLKAYFMHFYGGGYTNIQHIDFDWRPYFKQLREGSMLGIGYAETNSSDVDCDKNIGKCKKMILEYHALFGKNHYLIRARTAFTEEWLRKVEELMASNEAVLASRNPATYPFKKGELYGWVFQTLAFDSKSEFLLNMTGKAFDD